MGAQERVLDTQYLGHPLAILEGDDWPYSQLGTH